MLKVAAKISGITAFAHHYVWLREKKEVFLYREQNTLSNQFLENIYE